MESAAYEPTVQFAQMGSRNDTIVLLPVVFPVIHVIQEVPVHLESVHVCKCGKSL